MKNNNTTNENLTPLMKQYFDVKSKHNDSILFFRLGDFYEMFGEDAKLASKVLNITLTARAGTPMCGIPYHSSTQYIPKLLNAGHKIAICEQLEKPSKGIKIVNRNVVRVITPGTVLEENLLDEKTNNYLLCVVPNDKSKGIAISAIDISTGEIRTTFLDGTNRQAKLNVEISKYDPKEIIVPEFCLKDEGSLKFIKSFGSLVSILTKDEILLDFNIIFEKSNHLEEKLSSLVKPSIYGALSYVKKNYVDALKILQPIKLYENSDFLNLSDNTIRHLDLIENSWTKTRKHSLLDVLDKTKTPMGARLLKKWLLSPLLNLDEIYFRQDIVQFFCSNYSLLQNFRNILDKINDIERIIGRINCNINVPKDLISLKNFLMNMIEIKELISHNNLSLDDKTNLQKILDFMSSIDESIVLNIINLLEKSITSNPSNNLKDGDIIKTGFDERLDRLRLVKKNGKTVLLDYENEEKEKTKIPNLKIKFNNIFGYFFETTKLYKNNLPDDFFRIQTLSNCERFTTEKLKKYEIDLLESEAESIALESKIYYHIREKIQGYLNELQKIIFILSNLDVLSNFAYSALECNLTRPILNNDYDLIIKNGRHPVIESILKEVSFVPNDTDFVKNDCHFYLITGPNMAGKSTYIRQVALIVLMAQIGSFVPADYAKIGLVDKIFTRIGSGDKLVKGESTFLVEMKETVDIIKEATDKSLVILDEVGRGTSTFDGISLAWVIANELVSREWFGKGREVVGPKTLFATHYLELIKLSETRKTLKNFSLLVDDNHGEVIFLHKIIQGNTTKSYGVHVAKIAGLPLPLIDKAKKKLKELEQLTQVDIQSNDDIQFSFFENQEINNEIIDEIKGLDIENISPVSALLKLKEWQEKL